VGLERFAPYEILRSMPSRTLASEPRFTALRDEVLFSLIRFAKRNQSGIPDRSTTIRYLATNAPRSGESNDPDNRCSGAILALDIQKLISPGRYGTGL
jgi:hypothetical protein